MSIDEVLSESSYLDKIEELAMDVTNNSDWRGNLQNVGFLPQHFLTSAKDLHSDFVCYSPLKLKVLEQFGMTKNINLMAVRPCCAHLLWKSIVPKEVAHIEDVGCRLRHFAAYAGNTVCHSCSTGSCILVVIASPCAEFVCCLCLDLKNLLPLPTVGSDPRIDL